jgi:DNA-binding NarL/FixJ family response regulator
MGKISILIADDHKLIRETWTYILNEDPRFKVIAACSDGEEAVQLAKDKEPDVILMDISMIPISGFEATQQIIKISPGRRIIGVSIHTQLAHAKRMLQIGAKGYVTKNSSQEEMIKAILEVNDGTKYICNDKKNIISEQMFDDNSGSPNINALTEREMQIINLIKVGCSSRDIGVKLQIIVKTVEVHRHNILRKLRLKNSAFLVNFIHKNSSFVKEKPRAAFTFLVNCLRLGCLSIKYASKTVRIA